MDLPAGPTREFFAALNDLWWNRGTPSGRRISTDLKRRETYISQGTVQNMINGPRLPKWENVAAVVRYLNGNHDSFLTAWRAAAQDSSLMRRKTRLTETAPGMGGASLTPASPTAIPAQAAPTARFPDKSSLLEELRAVRRPGLSSEAAESHPGLALAVEMVIPQREREGMTRAAALRELLQRAAVQLDPLQHRAADALLGLTTTSGTYASDRRNRAASVYGVSAERFRKSYEPKIMSDLAESISVLCISSRQP
ncbi:hypothetical protein [Streptomyces virginiae]|uniref:hypothetical protein n=1 Tax=Streptomyces virginiae TaxID=1961 RepID=UPI00332CC37A